MKNKSTLTRVLAIGGTVFVWLPILAPIAFSIPFLIRSGQYRLDYLMPAELAFLVLIGAALLIWAAIRAHSRVRFFCWTVAAALILLFGSQGVAVLTGLASGRIEAAGWQFGIVLAMMIGYDLAVVVLGIGGIKLIMDIIKQSRQIPE